MRMNCEAVCTHEKQVM